MSRSQKYLNYAAVVALGSDYKYRHGAIMVKGKSIIKSAYNETRFVGFASKFHPEKTSSLHAEIGCILNLRKEQTEGCDIYVVRILKNGIFALSKPCPMCQATCSKMGINKIYYSIDANSFGCLKLPGV